MLSYIDHLILLINSMYILITVQSQLELSLAQLSPSLFYPIIGAVTLCTMKIYSFGRVPKNAENLKKNTTQK